MTSIREDLFQAIEKAREEKDLGDIMAILLGFKNWRLSILKPIIESLIDLGRGAEKLNEEETHGLSYEIGTIARVIRLIGSGQMSHWKLDSLKRSHDALTTAAQYLNEDFKRSQPVLGALALIVRAYRFRMEHDLPIGAIRWSKKLGKPEFNPSMMELKEKYPVLIPVAFKSEIQLFKPELYLQFFGGLPGLRGMKSEQISLLKQACEKWPFEDYYAFCPLPTWQADDKGEELWFNGHTWSEQHDQITRLQRRFSGVTVRIATLPELMYLDLCMRLATGGSPVGIYSFRCEHPADEKKCLSYGNVGDFGAEIQVDKNPEDEYLPVMPLFFLTTKPGRG